MKTKSSLSRIGWSLAYVVVAVVGLRVATGSPPSAGFPSPQQERSVTRKSWRVEPVKVVAARNKKEEKIELGKAFDDDDDWLDGFTVTVVNNSDKTVTAMTVEMIFRREPGDSRPPVAKELHFGPSPSGREYIYRDPNKVIRVGKTADLTLSPQNYNNLKRDLEQNGYPNSIKRVELEVTEVGFEDGSVLRSGTLYLQDPNNPSDPTKKVPARRPPRAQNHRIGITPERNGITSPSILLKASFT